MRAMVFHGVGESLKLESRDVPRAGKGQVAIRVKACGLCRTDLHVVDGDLKEPSLPLVPGHQIVGEITELGESVAGFVVGQRVGVRWLGGSCSR